MIPPLPALASPSLAVAGIEPGPAFEMKFLLSEALAQAVEQWARCRLALDPHGDPLLGGAYRTTSLYCDTPALDVYHRTPSYRRRKFRVRRYGTAAGVFLERKSRSGDRVTKWRTAIAGEELALLGHPIILPDWIGSWFHRRLLARRLGPACRVAYLRTAYVGTCPEGPLRLTLDRQIHGLPASEWTLNPLEGGLALLPGHVILELKFRLALPVPFKDLIQEMKLSPAAVSKYRLCREAWGVQPAPWEVADA